MNKEEWASLPREMTLRLVRVVIKGPGFRVRKMTLVTTLLNPKRYPKEALEELYRERWKVEVYFREIKQTLRLDILRCQKQSMIEREMCIRHRLQLGACCDEGRLG